MSEAQVEDRVRRTLAAVAATVESVALVEPTIEGGADGPERRQPGRRRRVVAAAVVALVILAAGLLVARRDQGSARVADLPGWDPETKTCTPTRPGPDGLYGSAGLMVRLPEGGVVDVAAVGEGYRLKLGWRRPAGARLTIDVVSLDGAGQGWGDIPQGYPGSEQTSAVITTAPGCYEVTGRVADEVLTFVVQIVEE